MIEDTIENAQDIGMPVPTEEGVTEPGFKETTSAEEHIRNLIEAYQKAGGQLSFGIRKPVKGFSHKKRKAARARNRLARASRLRNRV